MAEGFVWKLGNGAGFKGFKRKDRDDREGGAKEEAEYSGSRSGSHSGLSCSSSGKAPISSGSRG